MDVSASEVQLGQSGGPVTARSAGCDPGQYWDFLDEACKTPTESGCAGRAGHPMAVLLVVLVCARRRLVR